MDTRVLDPRQKIAELLLKQPKGAGLVGVARTARKLWRVIDTPVSRALEQALKAGDIDTIANAYTDPRKYSNAHEYLKDTCATSFLRKADFLSDMGVSSLDPEAEALATFYETERICRHTNNRLSKYARGETSPRNRLVTLIIEDARRFISDVLPKKVPKARDIDVRFGPGATSQCCGESVTLADKLSAFPEMTYGSLHLLDVVKNSPVWFDLIMRVHPGCLVKPVYVTDDYGNSVLVASRTVIAPRITRGNRFVMVDKTAKTKRGIAIEPHTLSCIQLAVGSLLSNLLERIGIQKDVAKDVHGRLARLASLFGELCTVDLKAASDTIAIELVKLLLPWDWFVFLSSLRSEETYIEGSWVELEKFSSMGNGFTFELETLIFYALTRAVSNRVDGPFVSPVAVFGDDIICSTRSHELLKQVLGFCGFTTNKQKTFVAHGFNESCGHDYFKGTAVRPYFLKKEPTDVTAWYGVANGIRRIGQALSGSDVLLPEYHRVWLSVLDNIPAPLRYFGPERLGDAVIHAPPSDWSIVRRRRPINGRLASTTVIKFRSIKDGRIHVTPVTCDADDQIQRVYGIVPIVRKRSVRRWCDNTIHAALLYTASSGGTLNCADGRGFFSLRGDPEAFAVTELVA